MAGQPSTPRRSRGGIPVFAIVLVLLGVLLLLQTTGVVPWGIWGILWRFWPVIVIAIGIELLLGRWSPVLAGVLVAVLLVGAVAAAVGIAMAQEEDEVVATLAEPLGDLRSVDVRLVFGAGNLTIRSLPAGSPNLVEGRFEDRGAEVALTRTGERGELRIEMGSRRWFQSFGAGDWDIALSPVPRLALDMDGGAADMRWDLRDLQVASLDVDTGAADVELVMPARAGQTQARIDGGAASISITIPEGVAARIRSDSGLSSINVDTRRFPRAGDVWESPDFGSAANRVELELHLGASSVSVR